MHYGYSLYANHKKEMIMLKDKEIAKKYQKKKKKRLHILLLAKLKNKAKV